METAEWDSYVNFPADNENPENCFDWTMGIEDWVNFPEELPDVDEQRATLYDPYLEHTVEPPTQGARFLEVDDDNGTPICVAKVFP